ncbi:MAG: glycosyltransferase family 1 protein, partial [Bacteroidota bacterium]
KHHFGAARTMKEEPEDQKMIPHPRFGFFGVIDERFDIELLDTVSKQKPEWHFIILGPVVKIDPSTLPHYPNVHYLGGK